MNNWGGAERLCSSTDVCFTLASRREEFSSIQFSPSFRFYVGQFQFGEMCLSSVYSIGNKIPDEE